MCVWYLDEGTCRKHMEMKCGWETWGATFTTCVTRCVPRRVREDDIKLNFDGPGCEDMHIVWTISWHVVSHGGRVSWATVSYPALVLVCTCFGWSSSLLHKTRRAKVLTVCGSACWCELTNCFCHFLTFCWPCIMQWFLTIVQLDAQILFNVFIYLWFSACFEHVMLIIRRNKMYQYSFW